MFFLELNLPLQGPRLAFRHWMSHCRQWFRKLQLAMMPVNAHWAWWVTATSGNGWRVCDAICFVGFGHVGHATGIDWNDRINDGKVQFHLALTLVWMLATIGLFGWVRHFLLQFTFTNVPRTNQIWQNVIFEKRVEDKYPNACKCIILICNSCNLIFTLESVENDEEIGNDLLGDLTVQHEKHEYVRHA